MALESEKKHLENFTQSLLEDIQKAEEAYRLLEKVIPSESLIFLPLISVEPR